MPGTPRVPVDLVVNCFERTYRDVLAPGHFAAVESDNVVSFTRRTALINNVLDRPDAERRAAALRDAGEIDHWAFVEDLIEAALTATGLTAAELAPLPYFTDWALAAVTMPGPEMVLLWDADVRLRSACDWVTPALELFDRDPRVLIANPNWEFPNLESFTTAVDGGFSLGHGASDQVMLGRRSELGQPIYRDRTLALRRYPVSHLTDIFEARIDSHLRRAGRLRATYRDAVYVHGVEMGSDYPPVSVRDLVARERDRMIVRALRASPWRPRHLRQL